MFIIARRDFKAPQPIHIAIDSIESFRMVRESKGRPRHAVIRTKSGDRYVIEAIELSDRPEDALAIASLPIIPAAPGFSVIEVPHPDRRPGKRLREIPIIAWRVKRNDRSDTIMPVTVRSYSGETFIRFPDGRIVNSYREFSCLADLEESIARSPGTVVAAPRTYQRTQP